MSKKASMSKALGERRKDGVFAQMVFSGPPTRDTAWLDRCRATTFCGPGVGANERGIWPSVSGLSGSTSCGMSCILTTPS